MAIGRIDTQRPVSLTLRCQTDQPVSGVEFSLYRVADVSETAAFQLTGEFKQYNVSLDQSSSAGWRALAETLTAYASRDGLTPLDSGKTGSDGTLRFPNRQKELLPGLYLVEGKSCVSGEGAYTPSPFLICLPNLDGETDLWVYDETADPKYTWDEDEEDTVKRKVLKIWDDQGNGQARPEQIKVQLLRNGKVWDTVTLSEKNNWRYTWTDLDGECRWQVVEKTVPEGYTVSISREGITFVMTNTFQPGQPDEPNEPNEPDKPNGPDEPTEPDKPNGPDEPNEPGGPDEPVGPDKTDKPDEPGAPGPDVPEESTLPQTGVLWWPVPVLAVSGMLLYLLGWVQTRKRGNKDDR